jgi:hypothetical protein
MDGGLRIIINGLMIGAVNQCHFFACVDLVLVLVSAKVRNTGSLVWRHN